MRPQMADVVPLRYRPPGIRRAEFTLERTPAGSPVPPPVPIIGVQGAWNCCDVYLSVPVAWLTVVLTLSAEVDGVEVDLITTTIADGIYQTDGTTLRALVFSLRGHPARNFKVRATSPLAPAANPGAGVGSMVVWGEDTGGLSPELAARQYTSGALDDRNIIEAGPAHLRQIVSLNTNAALRYLMLFDRTTLPPNGTAPDWTPIPVPSNAAGSQSFHLPGLKFQTGLVWAVSTTVATLTLGAADQFVSATYTTP